MVGKVLARFALVAVLVSGVLVAAPGEPAAAVPSLQLPFAPGQTWYVCQGYDGRITHSGDPALDLTTTSQRGADGCYGGANAAAGQPIHAPAAGSLVQLSGGLGGVCITFTGGGSMYFGHLTNRMASGPVSAGQKIGTVASAGSAGNNGYAHLHLSARSGSGCSGTKVPFSGSFRFQCAPDMTNGTPVNQWAGQALTRCPVGKPLTSTPRPSITSNNTWGSQARVSSGNWQPAPVTLRYQWARGGSAVSGATGTTYTFSSADFGRNVTVTVTGSKTGYTTTGQTSPALFVAKVISGNGVAYVNIRSSASTSASALGRIPSGTHIGLQCFTYGSSVSGPYGPSTLWYRIPGVGWVTDALLETNSNSAVTPRC